LASLYLELGSLIILAVFGFFFAFQRLREGDVLLIIFGVTGFYFAASLVRLTLLLAPVMATLAAITVVELGKPAMDIISKQFSSPAKLRFTSRVSREFSLGILLIILSSWFQHSSMPFNRLTLRQLSPRPVYPSGRCA